MKFVTYLMLSFSLINPINTWACNDQVKPKVSHHQKVKHAPHLATGHSHKTKERYKLVTYYVHGKTKHKYIDTYHHESSGKTIAQKHGLVLPDEITPTAEAKLMASGYLPSQSTVMSQRRAPSAVADEATTQTIDLDNDVPPPTIMQ